MHISLGWPTYAETEVYGKFQDENFLQPVQVYMLNG